MSFQAQIDDARRKQKDLEERLEQLAKARIQVMPLQAEIAKYQRLFESRLETARATGQPHLIPTYDPKSRSISEYQLDPHDFRRLREQRNNWRRAQDQAANAKETLDQKIKLIEKRKAVLDAWIIQKEETWGKIDPTKLDRQIREILRAAEELSQFIVGRKVEITFDLRESAPLGYVPIRKRKRELRKVYFEREDPR